MKKTGGKCRREWRQMRFKKVIVLTIPRLRERQEHVQDRLKPIDFEFFYGADKNELSDEFIQNNYQYDKKNSLSVSQTFKPMNKGEIACALSHRMIYQSILDNNWQHILIFEDDVVHAKPITEMEACLSQLPADWELCYLGYLKNETVGIGKKIKRAWYRLQVALGFSHLSAAMISRMLPRNYSSQLNIAGFHDCTHAYAISYSAAKKLLSAQTPITLRADNLLSSLILKGELKAFAVKHSLFDQEIFSNTAHASEIRDGSKISI